MSLSALNTRIRSDEMRQVYEPSGQDGYNCLLLAALHQLSELGLGRVLPAGFNINHLRELCKEWLRVNRVLQIGAAYLCEFGDEYSSFLEDPRAVGNHVVILAILAVFGKMCDCCFTAKVCLFACDSGDQCARVLQLCEHV